MCVINFFREFSDEKVLVSFLNLIFMMGRVGLGELTWKNTR